MGRRLMRAALVLTPLALLARYGLHADSSLVFVLAAVALAPLAFLVGEATENVALHAGPTVGALANASLGNAPELIIALFAVADGLPGVVLGSITGSIVSTLLLVCGGAMLAGGDGQLQRRSLLVQLGATLTAIALFLVPAVPGLHGASQRHGLSSATLPVAAVLLCLYVGVTAWNLRRKGRIGAKPPRGRGWGLRRAALILAGAATATALVSEALVDSLQGFGRSLGLSQLVVAAVVVALVGNAAEQGGAVVVARHGDPGLGVEIAVSSASQIAVFVCPAVALASTALGHELELSFLPVEMAAMGGAAIATAAAVASGRSSRVTGVALCAAYLVAVAAFVLAPRR